MRLINADKVIEKLKEHKSLFCKNRDEFRALSDKDKARVDEIDTCIAELVNAEEVQTTDTDSDTISRAKAIEAVNSLTYPSSLVDVKRKLADLPPAQPEPDIDDVTCDNCEYSEKYVDGLILCRRAKTSHRVSATSTCGKGKREVKR